MELLIPCHYEHHVLRRPYAQWPDSVLRAFEHLNPKVYIPMQGPSELGARGKLAQWDRRADLSRIQVPTLTIGAAHSHHWCRPRHHEFPADGGYGQGSAAGFPSPLPEWKPYGDG